MLSTPFYDPTKSYQENYDDGPYGNFHGSIAYRQPGKPKNTFFDLPVYLPFGIPAGPLINGRFVKAALDQGFDLPVYKTVRTAAYPCHPFPNVLAVHPNGELTLEKAQGSLVADTDYTEPLSITNSFGVPSFNPDVWQPDLAEAVAYARPGQIVIGSFQGTKKPGGNVDDYIADFVAAARLVKETGVKVMEVNLSCPNEGTADLLCFDTNRVLSIVDAIKNAIGDTPLILKLAYFANQDHLRSYVRQVGKIADGFAAINTIATRIIDQSGGQALPGEGRTRSGVCGTAIKWAGLEMVSRLAALRAECNLSYTIIGVGGVMKPAEYQEYREAGADAVMSATGAMWNPALAQEIKATV
ncbi:tRNA-dihydrouridine synthase [Patescibacteria group bacterium]|nr:tRNA-dihydrouridine synthase [Patescibacteria group bacterium]